MDERGLVVILEEALRAERDGFEFYTLAGERSDDPGARDVFAHLAEEERRHFDALQKEYRSILEGTGWDPNVVLGERWLPEASAAIFSEGFRHRIGGRHLEMAALSIGILLEKTAYEFYAASAEKADDVEARRFLRELAEWENGHYQLLLREDDALRDSYWDENRFAPLV
jgi:rubrerythrin